MSRHQSLSVLLENFSDAHIFTKGFLLVLTARNVLVSIVVTTMEAFPVIQGIIVASSSVLLCLYMLLKNPFNRRFNQLQQLFMEVCVLCVYICVTVLAVIDKHSYDN